MIVTGKGWTMHRGDCLEVMPGIERVDHVITDPPYEAEAHTKQRRGRRDAMFQNTALSFAAITAEERSLVGIEIERLPRRWSIVFSQIEAVHEWRKAIGLERYVRTMCWVKDTTTPQMTGDRPGMGWESMIVFHTVGKKRWHGGGRCGVFRGASVQQMGRANDHETQKPISLMLELVDLFTDPGETILDPFAGSATTGVACLRRGRNFIGIEKEPKYFDLCVERLRAEENGNTLRQERAGQISLLAGVK